MLTTAAAYHDFIVVQEGGWASFALALVSSICRAALSEVGTLQCEVRQINIKLLPASLLIRKTGPTCAQLLPLFSRSQIFAGCCWLSDAR